MGSRLRWIGPDLLSEQQRAALTGPGAPFELRVEDVFGAPHEVFARRPPNLAVVLADAARVHGDRPYLVLDEGGLTYAQVAERVEQLAGWLASVHGVGPGDRVAIVSANTPGYVLAVWATVSLGAIVVGLNGWWTADELAHGIELTTPKVILGDRPRLERLDGRGIELEEAVTDGAGRGLAPPSGAIHEDDPAVILFTSGTTGRPKGATLAHRNFVHFAQVQLLTGAFGATLGGASTPASPAEQDGMFLAGPLFHISGLVVTLNAPWTGMKLVMAPPGRWEPARQLALTEQHRITRWSGVPTQLWRLLDHPDFGRYDLSSLRTVGGGGANFPPELLRLIAERLPHVAVGSGYGSSETTGLGLTIGGPVFHSHPTSIGTPNPTAEAEVRAPDGGPSVPDGEVGEICLRHGSVFIGYWNNPDATAASLGDDRWYRTGDFGRIVDGFVHMESRMRDLIIRGGENVYPLEIENRLVEHPDIVDAAVVGVDHQVLGQEVAAVVVTEPGARLTASDVQAWVAEKLARFKVPAHVEFRTELPTTESGKVQKHLLEQEISSGGGDRRETPNMTDPTATVVYRWLAAGDAGELDAFDELMHPDAVVHAPRNLSTTSVEQEKAVWKEALAAMPDLRHDVQEVVVDGDVEMARVVVTGTVQAAFGGVEGTGGSFRIDQAVVTHLRDGKIAEAWEIADVGAIEAQVSGG